MSNLTYSDRVKDAAKKRREYVRTLAMNRLAFVAGCAAFLFCIFMRIPSYLSWIVMWRIIWALPSGIYPFLRSQYGPTTYFTGLVIAAISGMLLSYRSVKTLKTLPHVPPVAEQIAALPAEEILVRSSDEPAATSEELLRAARGHEDTAAEELVRADQRVIR